MGMGGIFGNDVQLGIPIMQVSLGAQALPTFSLLIVANYWFYGRGRRLVWSLVARKVGSMQRSFVFH